MGRLDKNNVKVGVLAVTLCSKFITHLGAVQAGVDIYFLRTAYQRSMRKLGSGDISSAKCSPSTNGSGNYSPHSSTFTGINVKIALIIFSKLRYRRYDLPSRQFTIPLYSQAISPLSIIYKK